MSPSVFVCGDSPSMSDGADDTVVIEGLCRDPGLISLTDRETDRAVLVLHDGAYDLSAVQKALRTIDVDPIGAQILDIRPTDDPVMVGVNLVGLVARATAFAGSQPEHVKPVLPKVVTRRGFLKPPVPVYVAAPLIDTQSCAAGQGCRACVDVCPQEAYLWRAGTISYDKDACIPCGACVTTCPVGAIENPAVTTAMLEAQVRAIVDSVSEPVGIRFVCSRGSIKPKNGWFDIQVPCSSMVPGTWLLATLLLGAGAATAVACSESGCSLELDDGAIQANDLAYAVLSEVGLEPERVVGTVILEPIVADSVPDPFATDRTSELLLMLSSATTSAFDIIHPASNVGVVEIDASACTLCGQCAKTCPTHALIESYAGDTVAISFDSNSCVNCTQCVSACPEILRGAITVTGRIDTEILTAGRVVLNEGAVATCEVCGKAIAPATMMGRIGDLLGEEFAATLAVLKDRCLDCRGRR
ncbi:MAG: 4Fe-4S dicluster domain-containing protein [Proteobacteria bacterium]|nr:4Fe-4S dicluster domain-containing protein [Pseudomonadota bacterium]